MTATHHTGVQSLDTPCIPWHLSRSKDGYGRRWFRGKVWKAHRTAYTEQVRELLPGEVLRHRCDNRACVNVAHLVPGTQAENLIDKSLRSSRNRQLKLLPEQVLEIKWRLAAGHKQADIAKDFGVNPRTISDINTGRKWAHLTNQQECTQ